MTGSGINTIPTAGDAPVPLVAAPPAGSIYLSATISNESGIAGSFSIDGGATWQRWPASAKSLTVRGFITQAIMFKRVAGGPDVTGLSGFCSN